MEDLHQDPETVIQQLRLLLAMREEELSNLRKVQKAGGAEKSGETLTDQLIKELEEKKEETIELRARIKETEVKAKERISRLADKLEEKDQVIASLRQGTTPSDIPSAPNNPEAEPAQEERFKSLEAKVEREREEHARQIQALETALREKENLLEEAPAPAATSPDQEKRLKSLEDALAGEREEFEKIVRSLEEELHEKDRLVKETQARSEQLLNEAAMMEQQVKEAAARKGKPSPELTARIRGLEEQLETKERSYHTAQAEAGRLRRTQQLLSGVCAGLSIFLLFIFSVKMRQSHPAAADAASLITAPPPMEEINVQPPAAPVEEQLTAPLLTSREEADEEEKAAPAVRKPPAHKEAEKIAYKVQKGDSLWLICQRVLNDRNAVDRVALANKLKNPRSLKVGDVIYLSKK